MKLLQAGDVERTAIYILGEILRAQGRVESAGWMFERYEYFHPRKVSVKLALIEIHSIQGNLKKLKKRVIELLAAVPLDELGGVLHYYHRSYSGLEKDRIDRIIEAIHPVLQETLPSVSAPDSDADG